MEGAGYEGWRVRGYEGWCEGYGGEGEGMSGGGCEDVHVCESTSGVCGYLLKLSSPSIVQASYPSPRVWTYRPGPAHDSPLTPNHTHPILLRHLAVVGGYHGQARWERSGLIPKSHALCLGVMHVVLHAGSEVVMM